MILSENNKKLHRSENSPERLDPGLQGDRWGHLLVSKRRRHLKTRHSLRGDLCRDNPESNPDPLWSKPVCVLLLRCAAAKEKHWGHGIRCCSPRWRPPDSPTTVLCKTLRLYLPDKQKTQRKHKNSVQYVFGSNIDWVNQMKHTHQNRESLGQRTFF